MNASIILALENAIDLLEQVLDGDAAMPDVAPLPQAARDDLAKWERAAKRRVKSGGDLAFNSDSIPATLSAAILGALEAASDGADVKRTFEDSRRWQGYP